MKLTIISVFFLLIQTSPGSFALDHDEPCSNDPGAPKCDFSKGLVCTDRNGTSVCRCVDEDHMEHVDTGNSYSSACMVFINGNCSWTDPANPNVTRRMPCRDRNSNCYSNPYDKCRCESSYLPEDVTDAIIPENRCLGAGHITNSCNDSRPCHPKTEMYCDRGVCQCQNPITEDTRRVYATDYDHYFYQCFLLPEVVVGCVDSSDCTSNAYCGEDRRCHCQPGYTLSQQDFSNWHEMRCGVDYMGDCSNYTDHEEYCNDVAGLDCVDGKCVCRYAPDQIYDEDLEQCVSPEGNPCTLDYRTYDIPFIHFRGPILCQGGLECKAITPGSYYPLGICTRPGEPLGNQ